MPDKVSTQPSRQIFGDVTNTLGALNDTGNGAKNISDMLGQQAADFNNTYALQAAMYNQQEGQQLKMNNLNNAFQTQTEMMKEASAAVKTSVDNFKAS